MTALPIDLPAHRHPVMPGPFALTPRGGGSNGVQTVLVVDDDEMSRVVLRRLLEAEGLEVTAASNGHEALAALRARTPDLVMLDVVMPGIDGFEICRRLKADPATRLTPVILVTGLTAVTDRLTGIDAGADDILSKPFGAEELTARVRSLLRAKSYVEQLERAESVVTTMALTIEARDPYTEGHCERLSTTASTLGRRLGLSDAEVEALRLAGILHDVGKINVPDAILLKSGPLTPDEWAVMREHPTRGEAICRPITSFRLVLPIIRHHHERVNGSGYPDGLRGDEIPMTAKVLQVVDVYDAITTKRPYKPALDCEEAFRILETETGWGWWDQLVVNTFRGMVDEGAIPSNLRH